MKKIYIVEEKYQNPEGVWDKWRIFIDNVFQTKAAAKRKLRLSEKEAADVENMRYRISVFEEKKP
jgi:hypothetical protein